MYNPSQIKDKSGKTLLNKENLKQARKVLIVDKLKMDYLMARESLNYMTKEPELNIEDNLKMAFITVKGSQNKVTFHMKVTFSKGNFMAQVNLKNNLTKDMKANSRIINIMAKENFIKENSNTKDYSKMEFIQVVENLKNQTQNLGMEKKN